MLYFQISSSFRMTDLLFRSNPIISDQVLMARVQRGETEVFAQLVERYQSGLRRVAHSRLGRVDWAEEVVQETFLAAFKARATFDTSCNFRTWLWTILLHQCHGHYHRRTRSVPVQSFDEENPTDLLALTEDAACMPLTRLLAKERSAQLECLLGRLPLVQADALRLRFFGELKFHEIAEAMQCSLNTAKNRVRQGLLGMAEMLPPTEVSTVVRESLETKRS